MTSNIQFPHCTLAIREFPSIPRDNDNKPLNLLVFMDLATPLGGELEHVRARWARKLVALLRPNDRLTVWWFTSNEVFGSFMHNQVIEDPATEIPNFLEKTLVAENLKPATLSLGEMAAKVNHLSVECSERKEGLVGYTDIDGFMMESAEAGLFTLVVCAGVHLRAMYACEFSSGEAVSSTFLYGSQVLGRKFFLGKDQFEEQVSFETAVRHVAGERMAEVSIAKARPHEHYGFVLFLVGRQPILTPCDGGEVVILPAEVDQFAYFSDEVPEGALEFMPQVPQSPLVWVAIALAELVDEDVDVESMLTSLGDVYLGNHYVEAFNNEDYTRFETACLEAAFNPAFRYRQGITKSVAEVASLPASEVEDMLQGAIQARDKLVDSELSGVSARLTAYRWLKLAGICAAALSAMYLGWALVLK